MKQAIRMRAALVTLMLAVCCRTAGALLGKNVGNTPLNAANYKDWPGIMPVVNHASRVYHRWVNGNEHFYYRGDTAALNDTLRKFAQVKSAVRGGPAARTGSDPSFDRTQQVPFGWNLHLVGGIARHLTTLEQGDKIWRPHPVLSIYVGGDIDLRKMRVPPGVTMVSHSALKQRTREALQSTDKTVRGWGAGELADLDPDDARSLGRSPLC